MTIERNGTTYDTVGQAWWIDGQIESKRGNVVARINAVSPTLRYPTPDDMRAADSSPYVSSSEFTGAPVTYMLDLTDDDLTRHGLTPTQARPRNQAQRVVTQAQHAKFIDDLQSER